MKKGFTMIELLAVITIIAIVIAICVPSILFVIDNTKKSSDKRSIEYYAHYIEDFISDYMSENNGALPTWDDIDNNIKKYYKTDVVCEKHIINADNTVYLNKCKVEGREVKNFSTGRTNGYYLNGTTIYFDVATGKKCSKEIYKRSYDATIKNYRNSLTGYNGITGRDTTYSEGTPNSCLKFYTFNDEGSDSKIVDMMLDHNTLDRTVWNLLGNEDGPSEILNSLSTSTSSWVGTETPDNYQVSQPSGGNYIINYTGYKARLMTLEDMFKIFNISPIDSNIIDQNYVLTKQINQIPEIDKIYKKFSNNELSREELEQQIFDYYEKNDSEYGWLYDRTYYDCEKYGCNNNADNGFNLEISLNDGEPIYECKNNSCHLIKNKDSTFGYHLATSFAGNTTDNWMISNTGWIYPVSSKQNASGVRPVISVLKSKL